MDLRLTLLVIPKLKEKIPAAEKHHQRRCQSRRRRSQQPPSCNISLPVYYILISRFAHLREQFSNDLVIHCIGTQGSNLEIVVPDSAELEGFVAAWVMAASDASGQCTKLCAQLEPLQSQDQLIQLIQAASGGISEHRKQLTALGATPRGEAVQHLLQSVPCPVISGPFSKWVGDFSQDEMTETCMILDIRCIHKTLACLEAQKYVEAYKKHVKVAQSLMKPGCT